MTSLEDVREFLTRRMRTDGEPRTLEDAVAYERETIGLAIMMCDDGTGAIPDWYWGARKKEGGD